MAKHTYTIASQEAVDRYGHELGDTAELDIDADEKRATIAAGWLEEVTTTKPADKPATKDKE